MPWPLGFVQTARPGGAPDAGAAQVARATVRDFEGGRHRLHRSTEALILAALDTAGVAPVSDPALGEGVFLRPQPRPRR